MSRIGRYETTIGIDVLVERRFGKPELAHLLGTDDELQVDVSCVICCDDPEDGPYADEVRAVISGTELELSEEAVSALDLGTLAAEQWNDSGVVPPNPGDRYRDADDRDWVVVGTGRPRDQADGDLTLLRRPSRVPESTGIVVDTIELVGMDWTDDRGRRLWRLVLNEPEPPPGQWRDPAAIYLGKKP